MFILNIATFIWLGCWAYRAVHALVRGAGNSLLFAYPILFMFCGVPLVLNLVFGTPYYAQYPWFAIAAEDATTTVVYCIFIASCPLVWYAFEGKPQQNVVLGAKRPAEGDFERSHWLDSVAPFFVVLPLIVALFSPDPTMYLEYTPNDRELHDRGAERPYHALLTKTIHVSLVAAAYLVYRSRRVAMTLALLAPFLALDCWLQGKRNVVAIMIVLLLYACWRRGFMSGHRLLLAGACAAGAMLSYSIIYQTMLRHTPEGLAHKDFDYWLEGYRIDFGRDDVIKLALYSELTSDAKPILEYRGQSLFIMVTAWIPRRIWPEKPDSYAGYLMTAARGGPAPGGGTMTSSCLDEALANFGLIGLLLGPFPPVLVCRLGDRCRSEVVYLLTVFLTCGLLSVSFTYWGHIAFFWFVAVCWHLHLSITARPWLSCPVKPPYPRGMPRKRSLHSRTHSRIEV